MPSFSRRKLLIFCIPAILAYCFFKLNPLWSAVKTSYRAGRPQGKLSLLNESINTTLRYRVAFMSCNRQSMHNPFWDILLKSQPNGIIWMGDNIYADHTGPQKEVIATVTRKLIFQPRRTLLALLRKSPSLFPAATPSIIKLAYDMVLSHPTYKKILSLPTLEFVTGTWDDHDYGINDGDRTYKYKEESKSLLLDFLQVSSTDPRRSSTHSGIYGSHWFIIKQSDNSQIETNVTLILLDTRYNKDPWDTPNGDILGQEQWLWLEKLLSTSTANVHLIVSSIQVLPEERYVTESWDKFPHARQRFLKLIAKYNTKNIIILSGDVHFAEIVTLEMEYNKKKIVFWEFTASGLTHATRRTPFGFGFWMDAVIRWAVPSKNTHLGPDNQKSIYTGRNLGIIDVVTTKNESLAFHFKTLNSKSEVVMSKVLTFPSN